MRVKIGDEWFDSCETPICIQLSEGEQKDIAGLNRLVAPQGKYAIFPDSSRMTVEEMREWLSEESEK